MVVVDSELENSQGMVCGGNAEILSVIATDGLNEDRRMEKLLYSSTKPATSSMPAFLEVWATPTWVEQAADTTWTTFDILYEVEIHLP